jgi:hypothetical protein
MSKQVNNGKAGLAVALVLGGFHFGWALLVAAGWAQPVIDFIFWVHFIKPVYSIEPFELIRAAMLVAMTAGVGFAIGIAFALVWNAMHKARSQ